MTVLSVAEDADEEAFLQSAGSWKGLIDADKFIHDIYAERVISTCSEPKR